MPAETDNNFGWKFSTRRFSDKEREELSKDNLAYYVATFIEDVCEREREIREDPEIPTDQDRSRLLRLHRNDARDQMLDSISTEFDKRGVGALDDDGPFSEGFTNWIDKDAR